jgi:hypothetical protein
MSDSPNEIGGRATFAAGLQRRGIIAALAALATGVLSKFGESPALAASGDPVLVGGNYAGTTTTVISNPGGIAIEGSSTNSIGVLGFSTNNVGMQGQSGANIGLFGTSASSVGLLGYSSTNVGLQGQSGSGIGLFGISDSSVGLLGQSNNGLAGQFVGDVFITGSLAVQGLKSAVVPDARGGHRRVFCIESTESYFEDFGRGELQAGRARVVLDADFAAIVHSEDYDVFPVPTGDCNGLYVRSRSATHFDLWELRGGKSNVSFSYRLVARRRDVQVERLPRVAIPPQHVPLDGRAFVRPIESRSPPD